MFKVQKAKREKLKGSISILGASGSGKTLSALHIAYGIVKTKYPKLSEGDVWAKVGLLDTEHKRSLIYEGMEFNGVKIGQFAHIDFKAPFSPARYDQAVKMLIAEGCEVVVCDSISHAWEGQGGILDMQQQAGGTFQAWNKIKPHIHGFIETLTQNDCHVITTMRTKQDYALETNELGKVNIRKLGLKPIMKDDLEYEFQIVFQIDENHFAKTTKDNSTLFEGKSFKIEHSVGEKIYQWLEEGIDVQAEQRKKREEAVKKIRKYQKDTKSEELDKYIAELESKANNSIEDFSLEFVEKALMLIENKVKQITKK